MINFLVRFLKWGNVPLDPVIVGNNEALTLMPARTAIIQDDTLGMIFPVLRSELVKQGRSLDLKEVTVEECFRLLKNHASDENVQFLLHTRFFEIAAKNPKIIELLRTMKDRIRILSVAKNIDDLPFPERVAAMRDIFRDRIPSWIDK
jgi:hypothetical protein